MHFLRKPSRSSNTLPLIKIVAENYDLEHET